MLEECGEPIYTDIIEKGGRVVQNRDIFVVKDEHREIACADKLARTSR